MTKITDLSAILGAAVDDAADYLTIVDMTETGAARNKKILVGELLGLATGSGVSINAQSGTSYTLVLGDANNVVQLSNAGAITLTIPDNSDVAFPVGTVVEIHHGGAGVVTFAEDTSVTILSRGSLVDTAGQEAVAAIRKVATDTWRLTGDIA
jgi:hypothetical protein